ncbi:MAG: hypothetical protein ACE5HX_14260, partial [bacterium]
MKPILGFLLAWTFLNIVMNLKYPAQETHLLAPLLISPEVLVILLVLCAAIGLGMPFHWGVYLPLIALVVFFRLFRFGDELVPMYFFRPFNLYLDSQFLPDLIHLLYNTLPLATFFSYFTLTLMLIVGIALGAWWAFKTIHRYLAATQKRRFLLGSIIVFCGVLLFLFPDQLDGRAGIFSKGFFHRIVAEFDFILHVKGYRTRNLGLILESSHKIEQTPSTLDKLAGADVYLFFVESYGQTIYSDERYLLKIKTVFKKYEKALARRGFSIYSNFLTSPAYGGSSWLAHGTIASGVNLESQLHYDLLITSDAKTIARLFNNVKYRTVSVMPGTQWPWPEGKFFGYQKKYYAWNF